MLDMSQVAAIRITLASPEQIRSWSYGEVTRPQTLNYQTGKPEPGGLFCERIFGPARDWSCFCGKYRHARSSGFTCEVCGVEIAPSSVRRERLGHIELVVPIAHPWFRSAMARLLDLSPRKLGAVLSYNAPIVTAIDESKRKQSSCVRLRELAVGTVLAEPELSRLLDVDRAAFQVGWGAEAVHACLVALDLDALSRELRQAIRGAGPGQKKAIKRLQIVEDLRQSGIDPAWMIFSVLPVLPPALRPLVELQNGHLAANDLNALYERVICRNKHIKDFRELGAPVAILNYEKRLLQDVCDALLDNAHRKLPMLDSHRRPLKSLTDAISGKRGRLRRNLLGKRVDYSARSVIVVDPTLKLHQCGLPTRICLELFKPFIIRRLLDRCYVPNARAAKRMVERARSTDPLLWDALEDVMYERAVLLNRAPTLHRLSIQAFEAVRVEGDAIRLHPLVCSAFNADFDGDQMAVHLPLSDAAQAEAWQLLLSTHNLRAPASGEPSIALSQDIALGLFYLTQVRPSRSSAGRVFSDATEALLALEQGVIDLHTYIFVRLDEGQVYDGPPPATPRAIGARERFETTAGRLLFNEALPPALRFRNYTLTKEHLKQLVADGLRACGSDEVADLADRLKTLGFRYATKSGTSFATSDIAALPHKRVLVERADAQAQDIEGQYRAGMISEAERERQLITLWTDTSEAIDRLLKDGLDPYGTLATIIGSGATKAKYQQIRQLAGMRGLLAGQGGRIIPIPVRGNYLEGLQVWEEFHAARAARLSLEARPLETATTGYLTRRLVEVGQEIVVSEEDCGTSATLTITNEESRTRFGLPDMRSRIIGRILAEPAGDLPAGTLLDERLAARLIDSRPSPVSVRSPLTCQAPHGVCRLCYGSDLATGQLVEMGLAVGVIAGQSIGEPGTQLSMRVFHSGGAFVQGDIRQGLPRVIELLEGRVPKDKAELSPVDGWVEVEKAERAGIHIVRIAENPSICAQQNGAYSHAFPLHRALVVEQGQWIAAGTPLVSGSVDPRDLLQILGREAVARYLVSEVQRVFRATGVYINEKHFEVITKQLLRYVLVVESGDGPAPPGEILDCFEVEAMNARTLAQGGAPVLTRPVFLGLTKCALQTRSWIAAASFQDTSRVLTEAALRGTPDFLQGLKERVVIGRRIPTRGGKVEGTRT